MDSQASPQNPIMDDTDEHDDLFEESPGHASSDELQSLPDDGNAESSPESNQPLADIEHDASGSESHDEITENYDSQRPQTTLTAPEVPKLPPSAGRNAGEEDAEHLWEMSGFLNSSNEPATTHVEGNLILPGLDSAESLFPSGTLEFSTAGLPTEAAVGEEGEAEEDEEDEELEDYQEYGGDEDEEREGNEEEEMEEETDLDLEKELEKAMENQENEDEDDEDNNSSPQHMMADLLADIDTSIAMSRTTAKYAAVPSLSTIEEVSETPTPERRRASLQQDRQTNDIAEARTVVGDAVFMETKYDEADDVQKPEEGPTVETDVDESRYATQLQKSPDIETEDLPIVPSEIPKDSQTDRPEDQLSNESRTEESLLNSDKISVQDQAVTKEVLETQNSSDQSTKEKSPQESPSNPTRIGLTDPSSRSSSLSHQSVVEEGSSGVHASLSEEATQKLPALLSPISPLNLTHSSERRRPSILNPLPPYRKASLPAVAVYSLELQATVSISPKAAKGDGDDAHLHPSDQKHPNLVESAEQSAITPDPGSPSCPPSPSQTVPPFVDTPPPLEPLLLQTAEEMLEMEADDPSKPVVGSTPEQPGTQQHLTELLNIQQEPVEPPDTQQEFTESLDTQQERIELTAVPALALPAPFTLSPETMEFLAKLPLPPPPPAAQQQPELSSYQYTRSPVLDHPRHPQRYHPNSSHLLDSYRPGLPTNDVAATTSTTTPETAAAPEAWSHTLSSPLLLVRHAFLGDLPRPSPSPTTTTTTSAETHTLTHPICPHRTLVLTRLYRPIHPCRTCRGRGTITISARHNHHQQHDRPRDRRQYGRADTECRACSGRGSARNSTTNTAPGARYERVEGPGPAAVGGFVEGWGVEVVRVAAASDGTGCVDDGGRCRRGDAWREGEWEGWLVGEVVEAMGRFVREREGGWGSAGVLLEKVLPSRRQQQAGNNRGRCWREVKLLLVMGRMGERARERAKRERERVRVRKKRGEREEEGARKRRKVDV